ncbi:MAG TPA: BREX system ATP-binding domain-containing protein [Solirubrobacterales bacterium]|jgi:DNA-binding CsgD family transcriptional regulator|nr:BREX system ATP-binding domain-containing protein [Solirubrobacterales bacterium]
MALSGETLVGRERELASIDAALEALGDGGAGCLAIEGEPGIGKSRLVAELRGRAEQRGCIVLHGQAAEFERDRPFGVLIETVDPYLSAQLDDGLGAAPEQLREELAAIFPALRGAGGAPAAIGDERYRSHRAVRTLFELLAEGKPLVIALDDLHWADEATIELLGALLRRPAEAPVLLALSFRPGSAPAGLTAALAAPLSTRLELERLSEDDAALLLADFDAESRAAIYRHGGGNPFYLEQLSRLRQPLRLDRDGAAPALGEVPAGVAASLSEELATLSPVARALLEAAAVAGEPFDPGVAGEIAELEQAAALSALDELLDRVLVRPTDVPRRFIFRHPLVRRSVYESIGGGSRLAAHSRAAASLRSRGAAAAELAHHVEQAASQGDAEAIEVLLEAAAAASGRAPAVAARWLDGALRLLLDADRERQISVRVALASALRSSGELERCREVLLETIALVGADDEPRRLQLTAWCAAVEHWLGHHDEAHLRLIRTWDELGDRGTPEATALQIELAIDGLYTLDYEQTLSMGAAALASAHEIDDPGLTALAAAALSLGESTEGSIEAAREHHAEAVALLDRLGDDELAPYLDAFYYIAWVENYLEHYDAALAHADRAIEIARRAGEGRLLIPLMLTKGYPLEMQGGLGQAAEICEAAVEAARLSGNRHYLFWALFELAWPRYFAGDLDGAIEACEESLRYGERLTGGTIPSSGGGPGWALAVALFTSGETKRAIETMQALGSEEIEFAVPVERCFDWETLALAELETGDVGAAEAHAKRAEDLAAGLAGLQLPLGLAARTRAAILLHKGEAKAAVSSARAGVDGAAAAGARLQAAFSRILLGQALAAAGAREEAIAELREAERELDSCGSLRERDAVRRDLRKLGVRREARGPAAGESGIASLTKREHEIAGLVTDRMTNKEIAAELFLSEKTIESHLRNIFFKLSASSRVDVARAFEREQRG